MHEEAIKLEQQKAFEDERKQMKAQLMQESIKTKNPDDSKKMQLSIRLATFADTVRD